MSDTQGIEVVDISGINVFVNGLQERKGFATELNELLTESQQRLDR